MTERPEPTSSPASFSGTARWVMVALALDAVAAPLVVAAILGPGLKLGLVPGLAAVPLENLFLGALALVLVGPALAVIAVALRGFGTVARDLLERGDTEPQQAIIRIFIAGAVLAYIGALAITGKGADAIPPLLAVDVSGILTAWLLFVHLMSDPAPSRARRLAAMVNDVVLISVFLHVGDAFAAPWFSIYLWVVLGFGFRFGVRSLAVCAVLALIGFAAVYATTPYWQVRWPVAAGIGLALVLLPSYAGSLVRRLTAAKAVAEEANAAKTRFLAIMSHELRTPLNSVIGMGSLIARTKLDNEQRDMLATMQHSAAQLLSLVNDVLDLSKLETGRMTPSIESFVLHEVMGGAVAIVRPQAEAKGLALTLRIDPRLPHAYRGLPLQLRQVLVNLLANAVKFTAKGHVAIIGTLVAREDKRVRFTIAVRDEGIGIPKEAQARIFDLFTQADESVTRRFGGTGLGLAIAKQLTELMGGAIALDSEPNKGSTFTLTLTLEQDSSDSVRAPNLENRKLVLISSDKEFAATTEERLRAWRGDVRWIAHDEQALGELALAGKTDRPVVLIVDGRTNPLAGLSIAHRSTTAMVVPPLIIFIAPPKGSEAIAGLAASQLSAVLEAPLGEADLASALLGVLAGDQPLSASSAAPSMPVSTQSRTQAPAPSAVETPPIVAATPLMVLVADDNEANCKILKSVLESAGHEVEIAGDGEAALSALERSRFDLALLDINMPEVSGYEVAKLYRVSHVGEWRLPIVALTADATTETERLCRDAGMDAVLTKPVEAAQLLSALDQIYARSVRSERIAVGAPPVVTSITAHPRFVADAGAVVDEATFDALRNLGGSDFVIEVVDTFRKDAWRLIDQLKVAAEKADLREFRDLMHSMRSGAANVGGVKLCQTLTSLRDVSTKDLRAGGGAYVEKIEGELSRLDTNLGLLLETQRRG